MNGEVIAKMNQNPQAKSPHMMNTKQKNQTCEVLIQSPIYFWYKDLPTDVY